MYYSRRNTLLSLIAPIGEVVSNRPEKGGELIEAGDLLEKIWYVPSDETMRAILRISTRNARELRSSVEFRRFLEDNLDTATNDP